MRYDIYYNDKLVWTAYTWAKAYDIIFNSYFKYHIVNSVTHDDRCDLFIADGIR